MHNCSQKSTAIHSPRCSLPGRCSTGVVRQTSENFHCAVSIGFSQVCNQRSETLSCGSWGTAICHSHPWSCCFALGCSSFLSDCGAAFCHLIPQRKTNHVFSHPSSLFHHPFLKRSPTLNLQKFVFYVCAEIFNWVSIPTYVFYQRNGKSPTRLQVNSACVMVVHSRFPEHANAPLSCSRPHRCL